MTDAFGAGRRCGAVILLFFLASLAFQTSSFASPPDLIEAGASQNNFYIEPSYDGASIALFGSVERSRLEKGPFDVAITLRGPLRPVTVWKKARRAGLWINAESLTFEGVPNYYAVLSSKPLEEIAPLTTRKAYELGIDVLQFALMSGPEAGTPSESPREFRDALVKSMQSNGLLIEKHQAAIEFLGARLFRARVFLPPAAGPGLYRADFYVLQKGSVAGQASADIHLNKIGIEAQLSSAAVEHPWLYGVLAVVLAAAVGGGASVVFRGIWGIMRLR